MKRNTMTRLLALLLAISLTGCGGSSLPADSINENLPVTPESYSATVAETSKSTAATSEKLDPAAEESTPSTSVAETSKSTAATSEKLDPVAEESTPSTTDSAEEVLTMLEAVEPKDELNEAQKNSIAMLNYLAVLSQEINASKNSRMFLEEAYASLINNTNPEKVNELTESHLSSMLDIIEKYRMIGVKRDRLQYIYNQNKARALKEAIPNPIGLLSAISSFDLKRLAASAIYMAVDSYSSYQAYGTQIAQEFLQDGWELDDEEAANLHESRKRAFMFMIEIVRKDNLPGELALSESAVEKYVSQKNNPNNYQKIQFFESEKTTYQAFGNYWLTLADCYYEGGDYEKCLEMIDKYEELQADIFRKDYYFAQTLPKAIVAAREIYDSEEYVPIAERYIDLLLANTEINEWSLRYFAAEIYLDLYAKTGEEAYIENAYEIAINNVNNLVTEQMVMNTAYLADVQEVTIPKDANKDEKKQIKKYNKSLKEQREVELPPVYEPLVLNCDLLFALAGELDISQDEKNRIEGILRNDEDVLFISESLDNKYSFSPGKMVFDAQFDKDTFVIPLACVSEQSVVKVTITNNGGRTVYDDFIVKKVDRPSDGLAAYTVRYTSKEAGDQAWSADTRVKIEIFTDDTTAKADIVLHFKVSNYKSSRIFSDTVEFEQVD